jgi:alanine racemase
MLDKISISRPNWIEIDLDHLTQNITNLKKWANSITTSDTQILLPVKADAYGHGIIACSAAAQYCGVSMLGVAHTFEAIPIRQYGIDLPILVLGPTNPSAKAEIQQIFDYKLTATVEDFETAEAISQLFLSKSKICPIHIKLNTGMNRYGMNCKDDIPQTSQTIWRIKQLKGLSVEGIYTHLGQSEKPDAPETIQQLASFKALIQKIETNFQWKPKWIHLANSGATLHNLNPLGDIQNLIRPGLASYGYNPIHPQASPIQLQPSLKLFASVRSIQQITIGEKASYGFKWKAEKSGYTAAISIGYGDGLPRNTQNGFLKIGSSSYPIVGTICMDTLLVYIGEKIPKDVNIGYLVQIWNAPNTPESSLENWADISGTIPYELCCGVARRLYRIYKWKNQYYKWHELKIELGIKEPLFNFEF